MADNGIFAEATALAKDGNITLFTTLSEFKILPIILHDVLKSAQLPPSRQCVFVSPFIV